jgi:hypothetical protein
MVLLWIAAIVAFGLDLLNDGLGDCADDLIGCA